MGRSPLLATRGLWAEAHLGPATDTCVARGPGSVEGVSTTFVTREKTATEAWPQGSATPAIAASDDRRRTAGESAAMLGLKWMVMRVKAAHKGTQGQRQRSGSDCCLTVSANAE